jgi:hypothetical protein
MVNSNRFRRNSEFFQRRFKTPDRAGCSLLAHTTRAWLLAAGKTNAGTATDEERCYVLKPSPKKDQKRAVEGSRLRSVRYVSCGFTGTFAPSRAGMPTLGQAAYVEPGGAGASGGPRAEVPTFNQRESAPTGKAGISGAPQAGMPLYQKDRVQPLDAGPPSATKDHPFPPAHRSHKATHARRQLKMPPRTENPTTQLNQQEMVRHQASSQPQRDPVSNFFAKLFR